MINFCILTKLVQTTKKCFLYTFQKVSLVGMWSWILSRTPILCTNPCDNSALLEEQKQKMCTLGYTTPFPQLTPHIFLSSILSNTNNNIQNKILSNTKQNINSIKYFCNTFCTKCFMFTKSLKKILFANIIKNDKITIFSDISIKINQDSHTLINKNTLRQL